MSALSRTCIAFLATNLFVGSAHAIDVQLFREPVLDGPTKAFVESFRSQQTLSDADLAVRDGVFPDGPRALLAADSVHLLLISLDRLVAANLVRKSPLVSAILQPGQFQNYRQLFDAQDNALGEALLAEIGREETVIPIAYLSRGQTAIVSRTPILSAADFKDQTIRSAFSREGDSTFVDLGANPVWTPAVDGFEVFASIKGHLFDAAELTPSAALTALATPDSGNSLATQYRPILGFLVANKRGWERLSERQKAAIADAARVADGASRADAIQVEERLESTALSSGVPVVNLAVADATNFRQLADNNLRKQFGDRDFVALTAISAATRLDPRPPAPSPMVTLSRNAPILFITDRVDEGGNDPRYRFGSNSAAGEPELVCGKAGYEKQTTRKIGAHYNGTLVLSPDTLPKGQAACIDLVIRTLAESSSSRLLLFVHGYNNTFEFSVGRAIASALDIEFDGVILVWSWPSEGRASKYMKDQAATRRTARSATSFVQALVARAEVRRLDIIAHSLGNRIALSLLDALRKDRTSVNLGSMVFAAADEDRQLFRDVIRDVVHDTPNLGRIRTLYAAQYDHPLQISSLVNDAEPVGLGGDKIMVLPGVESVDATEVEGGFWGSFTHSSHAHVFDVPKAVLDLKTLLMDDKSANNRGLPSYPGAPPNSGSYWKIPN